METCQKSVETLEGKWLKRVMEVMEQAMQTQVTYECNCPSCAAFRSEITKIQVLCEELHAIHNLKSH